MNNNTNTNSENADNLAQNEAMENEESMEQSTTGNNETEEIIARNQEEIEKLKSDVAELKDKNIRLIAEFDNARRRYAKETEELRKTASRDIVQALLVAVDDMNRATKQMESSNDINLIKEGISLVFNKFRTVLQQKGLKEMDAANQDFDADLHEAITEIPAPNEAMVGKIMDVVEPGYYLNDKLIRHAKVVVGK